MTIFNGTENNDTLSGGANNDIISGGNGDDILSGGGGDDTIAGDDGRDTLLGGDGNDRLNGGVGLDTLNGGPGDDTLDGGVAANHENGDFNNFDTASYDGAASAVHVSLITGIALDGDGGTDTLINIENVIGSAGNDTIIGNDNSNFGRAGAGDDLFVGNGGTDRFRGDDGNDTLEGGDGNDTLTGDDGDDVLEGGSGGDFLYGRDGNDRATYANSPEGIVIDLSGATPVLLGGDAEGDTLISIEGITGSSFADILIGDGSVTTFEGGDGSDFIQTNSVEAGGFIRVTGGAGDDTLVGGDGGEFFRLDAGDDLIIGGNSPGTLGSLEFGFQSLVGDLLSNGGNGVADPTGGAAISLAAGYAFDDGTGGQDTLQGIESLQVGVGGFNNIIAGNELANYLIAGAGQDTLIGGLGDDNLSGGAGNDLYVIDGQSSDSINHVEAGDVIDLSATGFTSFAEVMAAAEQVGNTVVITFANGETLTLGGTIFAGGQQLADLTANNFTFERVEFAPHSLSSQVGIDESEALVLSLAAFMFSDFNAGDTLGAVRIDSAPAGLTLDGVQVSDGQIIDPAAIDAGRLQFASVNDATLAEILFSVGDTTASGADAQFAATPSTLTIDISQQIDGAKGDDVINGGAGSDTLDGGRGNDTFDGGAGDDLLDGGKGDDILNGGAGSDTLDGGKGNDAFDGGAGDDLLDGGKGDDLLNGGAGSDTLDGGKGDDTLDGGAGDDILTGGKKDDTFVFTDGSGDDTITDFDVGDDTLDLSGTATDFVSLDDIVAAASETAEGLLIDLGGGDSVLLTGLSLADIQDIDLAF